MGYSSSGGPKGLGVITDSNTPLSDLTQIIALIAKMGNFRGGLTEAERDTIPAGELYEGLLVYNTDSESLDVYTGSGWVGLGDPTFSAITYAGIYSAGSPAPRLTLLNGWYALEGVVISSSASFGAGTAYTIGSIPSAMAPAATRTYPIMLNNVFGWISIDTAGSISVASSVGFTGVLIAHINSARWPDKAL